MQLPEISEPYELTSDQVTSHQKNGHIFMKHVAGTHEIDTYRSLIIDEVKRQHRQSVPLEKRDTYGKAFIQVSNLWEVNASVARFVTARRFAKIAADLMGVDGVRVYADQALFKEPGGGHTPWHQDQIYWPLDTANTVTMWMPLVPISQDVGSMTFASGSHEKGYINKMEISDQSHKTLKDYIEHQQFPLVTYGAMEAGDATFHSGWTLHSAPGNPTDRMREVITIIYFADGTRILEPDSNARKRDMERWFPGLKPGDLAAGPLNPLVFKR
jgi:ectoine hydroxylase-related dioxygenase (phytanoyl-CoA dioxygenase family)